VSRTRAVAARPLLPARAAAPARLAGSRAQARTVLGVAVGLTCLGTVMVYSSAVWNDRYDPDALLVRQLCWAAVAGAVAFACARVPLSFLRRHAQWILLAGLVLLGAVAVAGRVVNHSRRWLDLFGLRMQPSEFLKVAVVLYLADRLARREDEPFERHAPWPALLAPVGIGILLVMSQPDLGTSLFVAALAVVLLGLAGVRPGHLLPLALAGLPLLVTVAASKFRHVRERLAFLVLGEKASDQLQQAVIAVGSGGLFGVGLGASTHKLGGRVPELHTDFIFAAVGQELGFVGCAAVILAFMAFVVQGKRVAERARESVGAFPFYLAAGATFCVGFQALVNVAVVTACAPTKGVSLPFVSLGGSNLVVCFACVGLLQNVARETDAAEGGDPWR
jgi:cell division protein FtsW (lipid II flippase)